MNRKITIALLTFLMLANVKWCTADGIEFLHDKKFQEVLDMAKKQNRLVFMDCYTSWCGPCKRLAATVFTDSAVGEFFNSTYINSKFDMEKDDGLTIANKYGIRAYPTLLWLDGDGNVVHKIVGGLDQAGLIQQGKKAIDPTPGILAAQKKRYADGEREVNFLCDYLNTLKASDEKYDDVFKEYLGKITPSESADPKHTKTIFNLTTDIKSPGVTFLVKNKDYYKNLVGIDAYNSKINQLATKAVNEAPRADDKSLYESAINLVKSNKAPDHQEKELGLSMDYYQHMGDWPNYVKQANAFVKKYASKNAALLNDVSWYYFLNVNDIPELLKATQWSYQSINIDNKYTYNLTYAYLLYKLANYKEAQKACDYAIIRAKEENVVPSSATALKEVIAKAMVKN